MGQLTNIQVNGVDNELYITAYNWNNSVEICHLKGGNANPVTFSGNASGILTPGTYTILMVGINWGGPALYDVVLTIDGQPTSFKFNDNSGKAGLVWSQSVEVTVA